MTASHILVSSQQTRFNVQQSTQNRNIHIADLDLSVASQPVNEDKTEASDTSKASSLKKSRGRLLNGTELLVGAELKIQQSVRYCLLGRNGTGKSTLLQAMGEKLIPGLPPSLRVASLAQTLSRHNSLPPGQGIDPNETVLKHILLSDSEVVDIRTALKALTGDEALRGAESPVSQIRCYRRYQYDQLLRHHALLANDARLRSGSRGAQARKALAASEKVLEEHEATIMAEVDETSKDAQLELHQASSIQAQLQERLDELNSESREQDAKSILRGLGFTETMIRQPIRKLSGGWRMRTALASALLQTSDLLILDEPTNFLDLLGVIWLQKHLQKLQAEAETAVLIVSHDRTFIDATCDELIILRDKTLSYFKGNLSEYEADLQSRIIHLTRLQETQDKERERAEKSIAASIKQGKKKGDDNQLRAAKSRQRKVEDRSGMLASAKGTRFKLNRDRIGWQDNKLAEIDVPTLDTGSTMATPTATELRNAGALVALDKVNLKYKSAQTPTLVEVTLSAFMGDRIGIMGLNGAGKSTMVKVLTGLLPASTGQVTFHPRLKTGYFSQHAVDELRVLGEREPGLTALALLVREAAGELNEQGAHALLGSHGLAGAKAANALISTLSGGQLVRLSLVRIVRTHPNLLVLDEVSTHLDYQTVKAFSTAMEHYEGAIILVSHDRYMMQRVIEGVPDKKDADDSDDGHATPANEESDGRRRVVYSMTNGQLKEREGGVTEIEESVESLANRLSSITL